MKYNYVRFRFNSNGIEVWNAGKWIPADETILENLSQILTKMFPPQR